MKRRSSQNRNRKELDSLCGQPGPDDGVDPRDFFKPPRIRKNSRKDWQLCRQVSETLSYVLSGECHDEILRGLMVDEVQPAPDSHRLLVSLSPFAPDARFNPILALERLQQTVGRLRSEVGRSISRRKVPELVFRVVVHDPATPTTGEVHHDE